MIPLPANGLVLLVKLIVVRLVKFRGSFRDPQLAKELSSMDVMNSSEMLASAVHPENTDALIVTFLENVTDSNAVHPENVSTGMMERLPSKDTDVNEVQPLNA